MRSLSASVVKATGAVYQNAWRQVVYLTLVSAGAVIGQSWGVTGVAVGVSAAVVVHFCLMLQIGLNQTGADPGTLLRSHLRHACIAALIAAATYAAAEVGRGADFPAIGTLALAAAAAGAVFGGLWWGARRAFGTEGDWIRTLIRRRLGERAQ